MVISSSVWLGTGLFLVGCVIYIGAALNRIAAEIKEANRLKRAELTANGTPVSN